MQMTRNEIAEKLGISKGALAMCISRIEKECGEKFAQSLELSQYYMVLEAYSKPNSRRPASVTEKAKVMQQKLVAAPTATAQVVVNVNQAAAAEPQTPQPAPQTDYQGDVRKTSLPFRIFLFVVFVSVLAWQIHHTALLEFSITKFGGAWAVLLAVLFAVGVQFTALLLTIRKASKKFLVGAAVCEFGINILVYFPQPVLAVILVSAISAFTIYSYSELFIEK